MRVVFGYDILYCPDHEPFAAWNLCIPDRLDIFNVGRLGSGWTPEVIDRDVDGGFLMNLPNAGGMSMKILFLLS